VKKYTILEKTLGGIGSLLLTIIIMGFVSPNQRIKNLEICFTELLNQINKIKLECVKEGTESDFTQEDVKEIKEAIKEMKADISLIKGMLTEAKPINLLEENDILLGYVNYEGILYD